MFLYYLINIWKIKKLVNKNSIPPYRADPLARILLESFHLTKVGSQQNQVASHLGGLAHFWFEHFYIFIGVSEKLWDFIKVSQPI